MSQSDDPDDDLRWLNAIREKGTSVNESQRIGNALRKRHARMERVTSASQAELKRLERRLASENLFNDSISKPFNRPTWFHRIYPKSQPWLLTLTLASFTGLLIWRGAVMLHTDSFNPIDNLKTFRGLDLTSVTRIYTDLPLAGYQFQIVQDINKAEAQWKAALIEAGLTHTTTKSTILPRGFEIHIKLSPGINNLDGDHRLNKAPQQGEWVVYLIPEEPT